MITIDTPSGRRFALIGTEPHTRKDGTQTQLCVWQSCCTTCGAPFRVRTSAKVRRYAGSRAFETARCERHRRHGPRATA